MTTPLPDYPDVEKCIGALLRPLVEHDAHIGNFVVEDYDEQIGDHDTPFITVTQRGGPTEMDNFTMYPVIEVSSWGKSRTVARDTMRGIVRLLLLDTFGEQFMAGGALFDSVEDVTGSQENETENSEDRCMTMTFQLECRPMFD